MFGRKKRKQEEEELAPHERGPPVELSARGADDEKNTQHLLRARQNMGIVTVKEVIADLAAHHADRVMLDLSPQSQSVTVRYDIDGAWHSQEPKELQTAVGMLGIMKLISNLDVKDNRSRQNGQFGAEYQNVKYDCKLTTQGTENGGVRFILELWNNKNEINRPGPMGMREEMLERYRELVAGDSGLFIVSAPPNHGGFTTTWISALGGTDRYMRDFVAVYDKEKIEPEVENIDLVTYDLAAGETPDQVLNKLMLKQPEVLAFPEIKSSDLLNELLDLIVEDNICVFAGVRSKDAAEALLRLMQLKPDTQKFTQIVSFVLNTRLVRRLCNACKQGFQPPQQLLQKLGIPAGRVSVMHREWRPEDAETKKGQDVEKCEKCAGLGYKGRIAICELLVIDDAIREALVKQPQLEVIRKLAKKSGHATLQQEGILLLTQGITSVNELQRALK